jgi:hypothetical protein
MSLSTPAVLAVFRMPKARQAPWTGRTAQRRDPWRFNVGDVWAMDRLGRSLANLIDTLRVRDMICSRVNAGLARAKARGVARSGIEPCR